MRNRSTKKILIFASLSLFLLWAMFPMANFATAGIVDGKVPKMPKTDITIPWEEFKALIEELEKEPPLPPPPPPVELSVKEAKYKVDLSLGLITVDASFEVITFGKGWRELKIIGNGASLISLTVDGKDAPTKVKGDSVFVYLKGDSEVGEMVKSKKYKVETRFYVFAPKTPGPNTVSFSVPNAAVGILTMSFDGKLENVGVNGIEFGRSQERLSVVLESGDAIKIKYTVAAPKEKDDVVKAKEEVGEPIVLSEVMTVLDIEEEAFFVDAIINYEVRGAPTTSFQIKFPENLELIDVFGEGISGWELNEKKNGLKVRVGYEILGNYSLRLTFERAFKEGTKAIDFPKIVPLNVKRDTGYIAIVSGGGFEIFEGNETKLTPQDPSELPRALLNIKGLPPVLSYRYTNPDWLLTVGVEKGELLPVLSANADSANTIGVVTTDGKMVIMTHYYIRNRNLQYLKITLPEGGELWSARLRGKPLKVSVDSDKKILVPLPLTVERNAEPFLVETIIFVPVNKSKIFGKIVMELPTLNIPVSEMMATIHLPEKNSYLSFGGDMDEIEYFERILKVKEEDRSSSSFYQKNIKLRREVYERQQQLEDVVNWNEPITPDSKIGGDPSSQFQVPLRGEIHRFVKLIVISEKSQITATYINGSLMWKMKLFVLLIAAVGLLMVVRKSRKKKGA
jgi:hypothetical protein